MITLIDFDEENTHAIVKARVEGWRQSYRDAESLYGEIKYGEHDLETEIRHYLQKYNTDSHDWIMSVEYLSGDNLLLTIEYNYTGGVAQFIMDTVLKYTTNI